MDAHVVIGANYGDEGKGLMTDFLARKHDAQIVVRFNGGAQAGHTVVDGDVRHVFSHFSSGTLAGAATYLSEFFVCNPLLFMDEAEKIEKLGPLRNRVGHPLPEVIIDPRSQITTPWDMLLNQAVEEKRGGSRHGSCGVGFNETIERGLDGFGITAAELIFSGDLVGNLGLILAHYLPKRCGKLGLSPEATARCCDPGWLPLFHKACRLMRDHVRMSFPKQALAGKRVIFEGAQGLLLDQGNWRDFPHLTRSNTGSQNVRKIADEAGIDALHLVYVTRSYLTRHGAGPLPNEWAPEEVPATIVDKTNVPHPFQGALRFAPLPLDAVRRRIDMDRAHVASMARSTALAVTCQDQRMAECLATYESYGPTAEDVHQFSNPRKYA